ncbi:Ig domain-containing protein [Clostridium botulinum]|uniref:Ig-like domain-containing protein n=1 Tax=unclassified Clostridium TaxID=2614128 RepID=UPI00054104C3|nr:MULTISPECIES: Ig-like domain-containing protein [unclassified Clostridium]AIY80889.1 bacterial Ig-like domain family protein [Clostridium botulinum 202F]KAI3344980.1 Ig-like domain-containing protein [Clostridium botulinum]KON14028.1 cytochrome C biogenesis protein CcmH [Clostridium botulinum]MBY6987608.1 Ig domain-containing protein [Clostridium botulinum]MBY7008264.1 Ig domain-containing protein [Clostridium botulinum]
MKNFYKRIIIMFVMTLTIMGVGAFQNKTIANAATVGEQLLQPEDGWKRYDDTNENIIYSGNGWNNSTFFTDGRFGQTTKVLMNPNNETTIKFKFKGSKLRTYGAGYSTMYSHNIISIDGIKHNMANWSDISNNVIGCSFEIRDLQYKDHIVTIEYGGSERIYLDSIDIDDTGYLVDPNSSASSISLDKSSLSLKEGSSDKLTATTTPAAVDVTWSSSDETIATVDENGKVTGIKEGTCIVTAQIKGTDVKATCEVTVTKEDIVEPEEPIENGSLYLEMIDGNIKRADKSQIEKFKKWFISRDLDETESPIFKITNAKGNTEYLVHDKVVGFEIRE